MGPVQAVQSAYRNYANFNGRASRPEFWWFTLLLWLSLLLVAAPGIGSILWVILCIASILPALAVTSRRLHDTGRSGWWGLLYLLGLIGGIFLYIMCAQPGGPYNNQYGPGRLPPLQNTGAPSGPPHSHPYAPPPAGGYGTVGQVPPQPTPPPNPAPDPDQPRFCTQCGMNLQPAGRFCTVCGKAV